MLWSRGGSTDIVAYNGSGKTPAAATLDWYRNKGITTIDRQTPHAVTVPAGRLRRGAVSTRSWPPADGGCAGARRLNWRVAAIRSRRACLLDTANQLDLLKVDPSARRIFLDGDQAPPVGHIQYQRELAATMELIGREGPDAFYRGDVADDMVSYLQEHRRAAYEGRFCRSRRRIRRADFDEFPRTH